MKALKIIKQTRNYLDYLEEHLLNVEKAWNELGFKCKDMDFIYDDFLFHNIDSVVKNHDLSKLSKSEFIQYRDFFFPTESANKGKLGNYWRHHKANNPHHWENWTKQEYYNPYEWAVHCVHMIIDWMAMGYKFGDTAQQYYESNKNKIKLPDYAVKFIYEIFSRLTQENRQWESIPKKE